MMKKMLPAAYTPGTLYCNQWLNDRYRRRSKLRVMRIDIQHSKL